MDFDTKAKDRVHADLSIILSKIMNFDIFDTLKLWCLMKKS